VFRDADIAKKDLRVSLNARAFLDESTHSTWPNCLDG
jgi:hypothetical protein